MPSCSGMDIFPTLLSLAGVTPPSDRRYDGIDATNILLHGEQTGHEVLPSSSQSYFGYCQQGWCIRVLLPTLILLFFSWSFCSTPTVVLQGRLVTCRQFEQGNTKLSTSQVRGIYRLCVSKTSHTTYSQCSLTYVHHGGSMVCTTMSSLVACLYSQSITQRGCILAASFS